MEQNFSDDMKSWFREENTASADDAKPGGLENSRSPTKVPPANDSGAALREYLGIEPRSLSRVEKSTPASLVIVHLSHLFSSMMMLWGRRAMARRSMKA